MRLVSEALVWSEQNSSNFFEYSLNRIFKGDNSLHQYLTYLKQTDDKSIILQIVQSANMLIHNLKNHQDKDYLLNHIFYKEILKHSFDFSDEEITENFVSLVKGLAVNVPNPQLISYLTNNNFNLFTAATMFMNHPEWLIKTASKTTILKILSRKYLISKRRRNRELYFKFRLFLQHPQLFQRNHLIYRQNLKFPSNLKKNRRNLTRLYRKHLLF